MKRFVKIFSLVIVSFLLIFIGVKYSIKYLAKEIITESRFHEIINEIELTPSIPKSFKTTYRLIYPDIFENNFNSTLWNQITGKSIKSCPCKWAVEIRPDISIQIKSRFNLLIFKLGFIWSLEDKFSQEKCFEFYLQNLDFLFSTRGINQASKKYYNKPLYSLDIEEQLGLILMINNPSYYNKFRFPENHQSGIEEFKRLIILNNQNQ